MRKPIKAIICTAILMISISIQAAGVQISQYARVEKRGENTIVVKSCVLINGQSEICKTIGSQKGYDLVDLQKNLGSVEHYLTTGAVALGGAFIPLAGGFLAFALVMVSGSLNVGAALMGMIVGPAVGVVLAVGIYVGTQYFDVMNPMTYLARGAAASKLKEAINRESNFAMKIEFDGEEASQEFVESMEYILKEAKISNELSVDDLEEKRLP